MPLHVAEQDHRPVFGTEVGDGSLDLAAELPVFDVFVGVLGPRLEGDRRSLLLVAAGGVGRAVDRDRIELLLSQIVDGMVVRDLEDPIAELVSGLVRVDGIEGPDEGFLGQVLGEGAIADHTEDQAEDRTLVA
jgi:hypothetical protein